MALELGIVAGGREGEVLGVDDFAFERGAATVRSSSTSNATEVVDLLLERSQESLLAW